MQHHAYSGQKLKETPSSDRHCVEQVAKEELFAKLIELHSLVG